MDYNIKDLLEDDFFDKLELEVMQNFSRLKMVIMDNLETHFSVDRPDPRKKPYSLGDKEFMFPITMELWTVYKWVIGKSKKPMETYEILQSVCEMVWSNPFIPKYNYTINWEEWKQTRLGSLVDIAFKRLHLESGRDLSANDLSVLAGISAQAISQKIPDEIQAEKKDNKWQISADEALKFLKNRDLKIYKGR